MSLVLLTYPTLSRHAAEITHFCSTRSGGHSIGLYESLNLGEFTQDNPSAIAQNRALLAKALGILPTQLYFAHQTHGTAVKLVDSTLSKLSLTDRKQQLEGYDALISNTPNLCLTVTTADCVPILLYDSKHKAIAAIHSGWKSTLENIVEKTLITMQEQFGTKANELVVSIGPCIGKEVYEVGDELYTAFKDKNFAVDQLFESTTNGKHLFDIRQAVFLQLTKAGVSDIIHSPYCTYTDEALFFSARRQGANSGRMLSGIMIRE